jgi:transposase InsO family protein
MSWKATDPMKERIKFILEWEARWNEQEGQVNVSELCRAFGISRQTGYLWIRRYRAAGHNLEALEEGSRRPRTNPNEVSEQLQDLVVAARKLHPRWGPRKLRAWLEERHTTVPMPSASAMSAILKRRGMITPRRLRRRQIVPIEQPFAEVLAPNALWCVDFKGWFRMLDRERCYPLTLLDAYSRYLLRCEALLDPDGREVEYIFDSAFREFGLPDAIRSDNGPPFASNAPAGLTRLAVWWLKLGIRLERIEPGKPQQNGRQERFHLTLKLETEPQPGLREQQRAFDLFRREYNEERPHEALQQKTPTSVYQPSRRHYPRPLIRPDSVWGHECRADKQGHIVWNRRRIFISSALAYEYITVAPVAGSRCEVYFGPLLLGTIDENDLARGLIMPPRKRKRPALTTTSLDPER